MKPTLSMNSNHVMVRELKDYLMIALGMIFYGIGWTVFLLPNDLPSGKEKRQDENGIHRLHTELPTQNLQREQ